MTNSIFDQQQNNLDQEGNIPEDKDYLSELVGEGKPFKDTQALARSKVEANAFIDRLKKEAADLRQELNTRLTMEQYLDKMGTLNQRNQEPDAGFNEPNDPNFGENKPAFKQEDIEKIVDQKVSEREWQRIQAQNIAEVKNELNKAFGNSVPDKLREASKELGMTEQEMNELAAAKPKAFLKLVGALEQRAQSPQSQDSLFTPPRSVVNTGVKDLGPTAHRDSKYYRELKQKDPKEYWTPRIQNQMHKDALSIGEAFFN